MDQRIFYLDCDGTSMDTDRLSTDLHQAITTTFGTDTARGYGIMYERIRTNQGGVNIPLVLSAMRGEGYLTTEEQCQLAIMIRQLPYQDYLFPGAQDTVNGLSEQGAVYILSDGDPLFQNHKLQASGLAQMVSGVIITPKKVALLDQLQVFYPAEEYVFIEDKATILDAAKGQFGSRVKTVHIRQGKYAQLDPQHTVDLSLNNIADLATYRF